ncbi:hypothetical protein QA600_01630 [Natronococcus sp. A-GB1]|uniref:hypothetical protein n=1 Tax=Natronococcus sp. A-GB1 TaxID=3037648 RepID=UPI00241D8ADA|nr:hypothetical protein [Natronococcus sp. A-GB1]MDG5758036.1 hypothetical protein [Natronococcus sp. A-GB1]
MTSALLLAGFCAAMTVVAVGRLLTGDEPTPYQGGIALLALGITLLAGLWSAIRMGWSTETGRALLGASGVAVAVVGAVLLARYWGTAADGARDPMG